MFSRIFMANIKIILGYNCKVNLTRSKMRALEEG